MPVCPLNKLAEAALTPLHVVTHVVYTREFLCSLENGLL